MNGTITVTDDEWHFGAGVYDGAEVRIYVDGVLDVSRAATGQLASASYNVYIGENDQMTGRYMTGILDDVRVYSRGLTEEELDLVMAGKYAPTADAPYPADEATDVPLDVTLSWNPGELAVAHDVYFGTSFDDVNTANTSSPMGVLASPAQDSNSYTPLAPLEFGTTYYWRIDEVNAPSSPGTIKGEVWSFTTEPFTYVVQDINVTTSSPIKVGFEPEHMVDGSGINADGGHSTNDTHMWQGALDEDGIVVNFAFDRPYKIQEIRIWNYNYEWEPYINFSSKDITIEYAAKPDEWVPLGDFQLAQGPGKTSIVARVLELGGIPVQYVRLTIHSSYGNTTAGLSEVQFHYIPTFAREPKPENDSEGVSPEVTLSWRPGREATRHMLHVGNNPDTVAAGQNLVALANTPSYDGSLLNLQLSEKYYWMVTEVNDNTTPASWDSPVWDFNTADYIVVDDMESYDDEDNLIYSSWVDGLDDSSNGSSQVGFDDPPYTEQEIVHSGSQAMIFQYGIGSATYAEADLALPGMKWTLGGATALVLYFYGDLDNAPGQLYVKVNNTRLNYSGETEMLTRGRWNQAVFNLSGAPVSNVTSLTIGIDSYSSKGTIFVDDIRLYKVVPDSLVGTPVNPGTAGLIAYYKMENNFSDSSGSGLAGTGVSTPAFATGLNAFGTALSLSGTNCVDLGNETAFNPTGSFSVSLWAKATAWDTDWGHVMVSNYGEGTVGWQVRRYASTANIAFTTRGVGNDDIQGNAVIPENEWMQITCVYDNDADIKCIYVNGALDTEVATDADTAIEATTHNTYIGARATSDNSAQEGYFTGLLDEVRLFNRALSAGEVEFLSDPTP
jgi:hypothetical protein